jgi:CBS domain-containing protein
MVMVANRASLGSERIAALRLREPIIVTPGTPLGRVIETMQRERRGAVLVCAGSELKGIFTERHVVTRILGGTFSMSDPIEKYISGEPVFVTPSDKVSKAIDLMAEHGLRHLTVCGEDMAPLGIVSVRNIIDCLAEHYPTEILNQPPRADQSMAAPEGG